jgi:hypothetical protein
MDPLDSQTIRAVLGTYGAHDLYRTDDHEIARRFGHLISGATRFRTISDVETAITFLSKEGRVLASEYIRLFETAVDLLSFRTPKDTGILYSGQYSRFVEHDTRGGTASGDRQIGKLIGQFADSTVKMRTVALSRAGKCPIDKTEGGRWLLRFNLAFVIGGPAEQAIWARASAKLVRNFEGEVEVFLAFPEFDRVFRSVEGHTLFQNPNVTRIVYFLEHGSSRLATMPPELFAAGIVRQVRGKELVFRVAAG